MVSTRQHVPADRAGRDPSTAATTAQTPEDLLPGYHPGHHSGGGDFAVRRFAPTPRIDADDGYHAAGAFPGEPQGIDSPRPPVSRTSRVAEDTEWGGPGAVTLGPHSPTRPVPESRDGRSLAARATPTHAPVTTHPPVDRPTIPQCPDQPNPVPARPRELLDARVDLCAPGTVRWRRIARPVAALVACAVLGVLTCADGAPATRSGVITHLRPPARRLPPALGSPGPAAGGNDLATLVHHTPGGDVSIAALDTVTGRRVADGEPTGLYTASVVKLDILETLLLQSQDDTASIDTAPIDDHDASLASRMIENSDNDAATALWDTVGGATGLEAANRRLGVHATVPDRAGHWGLTTTGATDQLALLSNLLAHGPSGPGPLSVGSRRFVLDLMRHVEPDQAWGVSAAADPATTPAVKNGWLTITDDHNHWAVASVGIVTINAHPVLMAVLTRHQPTQEAGTALIQTLAHAAGLAVTADQE